MISKPHRFHGSASLRFVQNRGLTTRGPYFSIKCALNNRRSEYRAAVVVSKKIHKSAVQRNRMRRRLYEIIRRHEARISLPYDILVVVHNSDVATEQNKKLEAALVKQLQKASVLR